MKERKDRTEISIHKPALTKPVEHHYYNPDAAHFNPEHHELKHTKRTFLADKNPHN